jgi:hypothetical protein
MELPILCKQAYWLGRWLARVEIDVWLMPCGLGLKGRNVRSLPTEATDTRGQIAI